jgi:hypothetical protein
MRRFLPLLALIGLLASACGGDDGMTASEYRAAAKQVCVESKKDTEAVERPQRATTESIANYLQRLLAANEKTTKSFAKLDPPEKLQKAHDAVLKVNEEGVEQVRGIVKRLNDGDDPAEVLQSATGPLRELNQRSNDAAKKLGVAECAQEADETEE